MDNPWGVRPRAGVIVVDDDEAWQRAIRRSLRELDVRRVYCMTGHDRAEEILAEFEGCVVLTELHLAGNPLAGLSVVDAARRRGKPAAIVSGAPSASLHP